MIRCFRLAGLVAVSLLTATAATTAFADSTIEAVGTCLTDSTTGKDRKDLIKWIFVAVSKHPELSELSSVAPEVEETVNRRLGELFTRLVAQDCPTEIAAMVKAHGPASLSQPFEVLGKVAMQELMTHPNVAASLAALDRYVDQSRLEPVLQGK